MRAPAATLAVAGLLAIAVPTGLDSCGIAPPEPVFATSERPADLNQFVGGKIGVLQRTYHQRYLIGAFRILSGAPLTEIETQSILAVPPYTGVPPEATPFEDMWSGARAAITQLGRAPEINVYKELTGNGVIGFMLNCHDDAFRTAVLTLEELSEAWGKDDPKTLDWVRAQDQVFADCSSKDAVIPDPPGPTADALFAGYRRYQIAAAIFYSGQYRKASQAFDQIAADPESPWQEYGPYLAARALVREGVFNGDKEALEEGERRLAAIAEDPQQTDWQEASRRLLQLGRLQAEPRIRLAELNRQLMNPSDNDDVGQSVIDFLTLINKRWDMTGREWSPSEVTEVEKTDELAAWMLSMTAKPPADAGAQSMAWWRRTLSPAWLISALMNAPDEDLPELLAAARQVQPAAAAYESVAYYAISREMGQGRGREARVWAEQALSHSLSLSSRNLILARCTALARNWSDFLVFALRRPEPHIVKFEGHEVEAERTPIATGDAPVFGSDAIAVFNYSAPLSAWINASESPRIPASIQLRMAVAGWLRALLIGKDAEAHTLMERVARLQPASAREVNEFVNARNSEEAHFAAVYLVLRAPALRPALLDAQFDTVNFAVARNVAADAYGHRFGCWYKGWVTAMHPPYPGAGRENTPFITAEQRGVAEAELEKLLAAEPWEATYLARQTLDWAAKHPDDPRVPEALHRAVMASYYRCTDEKTGTYSKQAFDLLHRKYAKSEWTARTPYWYK